MIMNHTLTCPFEDDADYSRWLEELESNWRQQSLSPYQIFNDLTQSYPELIDDFPLYCVELEAEKNEIEACVGKIIQQGQRLDEVIAAMALEISAYPLIERLIVVESVIYRMRAKYNDHYQSELHIVHRHKGVSEAEVQMARETSILIVGEKVGLQLQKAGTRYRCCCPLHEEKTASCTFFSHTNSWYCFGCHIGGDGISLVEEVLGMSFIQAVRFIIS